MSGIQSKGLADGEKVSSWRPLVFLPIPGSIAGTQPSKVRARANSCPHRSAPAFGKLPQVIDQETVKELLYGAGLGGSCT